MTPKHPQGYTRDDAELMHTRSAESSRGKELSWQTIMRKVGKVTSGEYGVIFETYCAQMALTSGHNQLKDFLESQSAKKK